MYGYESLAWYKNIGDLKNLFAIVGSIGVPIYTDATTNKSRFDREYEHFVHVLVDVDPTHDLLDRVLVGRIDFAFFVDITYENFPPFCNYC